MADHEPSMIDLIGTALRDARDLVRSEIELAKAELRQEGRRLSRGVGYTAGAALAGVLALVFLLTAIAYGLATAFAWPVWIGFGIVTLFMAIVSGGLAVAGRRALATGARFPRTTETIKENRQWIRARTS